MKKIKLFIFILGVVFVLSSCSKDSEKEQEESYDSIANETGNEIKLPEGAKIVENPENFKPVVLDQTYNLETDTSFFIGASGGGGMTTDGNTIYLHSFNEIEILDIQTKSYMNLCNKPQCTHTYTSKDCNGYFLSCGIQYFEGSLYTVKQDELWEGDEEVGSEMVLYKISLDGSVKEKVCVLATIYKSDMVAMPDSNGTMSNSIYWIIHRGYIYYVYDIGTSGLADNTCYNNMSNYISRMKIGKNEKREYIMPLNKDRMTPETDMWGYGSYVYFLDIEISIGNGVGYLYRFNTESGEVEKLPFEKRMVRTYTAWDDFLLYTNIDADGSDTGLYKYNKDGLTEKIMDFADYDKRFGTLSPIFLFRDTQYIYATAWVDKEENITKCIVFDCEGNYISSFDCRIGDNKAIGLCPIDNKIMFMYTDMSSEWYYFDKEELKTGEIHPIKIIGSETEEN
ncbi:MAG: DUF5050 domain-containing protein [Lachnospiraceae bacterium]|nr:DUF5050 domain-containing protein [Lachnospiraceae bacterium]